MATSAKKIYASNMYASDMYAAGMWRGIGITVAVAHGTFASLALIPRAAVKMVTEPRAKAVIKVVQ